MSPARILQIALAWDGAPAPRGEHASVSLTRARGGLDVRMDAPLHRDPPPPGPPGPTWELWNHEVLELFVLGPDERYTELEIGPHGHHLLLRLAGRRTIVERCLPLDVDVRRAETRWSAVCHLGAAVLPPPPWRINAYAIHGAAGERRHLAWTPVPGPGPDFHRLELFPPL